MKKALIILASVLSVILVLGLGASLFLNASSLKRIDSLKEEVRELKTSLYGEEGEDEYGETVEDGVKIAEEYEIRSTLPISDAYKSGDRSALSDKEKETLDMASEVLDEIIKDGMSDYEKEEAVYLWMTNNLQNDEGLLPVIPTTQDDSDNPYGVLKYHNAVCVGYATTFRLFMQMLDIDCMVVHSNDRSHTWDLVKLGDGWYHTDIYSDVGIGNYSHFNRTDDMVALEQEWDTDFYPSADSYEYCYVCLVARDGEDIYDFPRLLREAIDSHETILSLKYTKDAAYIRTDILDQMASQIQDKLYASVEYSSMYMDYNTLPLDGGFIFAVNMNYYDDEDPDYPDTINEKDLEKIDKAIEGSFGDLTVREDWKDGWNENDGVFKNSYDGNGVTKVGP